MSDFINGWQTALKQIEDLTGLSSLALGRTPEKDVAVASSERALQSTHTALKPLINKCFEIKKELGDLSCKQIQLQIKNNKEVRDSYAKVVGLTDIELVKKSLNDKVEYGIYIEPRLTSQDKQIVLEAAQISLNQGRDGRPGISTGQYMYIKNAVNNNVNLKELSMQVDYMIEKAKEQDIIESREKMKAQSDYNLQLKQQEHEMNIQKSQIEAKVKMQEENAKGMNEIKNSILKHNQNYIRFIEEMAAEEKGILTKNKNKTDVNLHG